MPTILGANSVSGFNISNSVRFNEADAAELTITPGSAGNRRVFTFAGWFKRSGISNRGVLFRTGGSGDSQVFEFIFHQSDYIMLGLSTVNVIETNALFRDPSAWYHIVLAVDTTQGTASNRVKLYINGQQNTDWGVTNLPSQNDDYGIGRASTEHTIGASDSGGDPFEGYMANVHYIDGIQKAASDFGETNDNGVWVPKEYTGSFGSNGFLLEYKQTGTSQNSSGIGADTSGNDNHMAVNNLAAIDVTTDTPTNNFATLNSIAVTNADSVLSEGNTIHTVTNGNAWIGAYTTLGAASGKWYAEVKILDVDNNSFGVIQSGGDTVANINTDNSGYIGKYADGWGWWGNGNAAQILNNNSNTDYGSAESVNDIYMIAVDIDGGKIWVGKNGTWFNAPGTSNVGDPANGNNAGVSSITFTDFVHFASGNEAADDDNAAVGWNFGNPSFSISSGNSDGAGYGNFEYAVPSGYYSLCTKNLAEYG